MKFNGFHDKTVQRAIKNIDKLNDWEIGFIGTLQNKAEGDWISDKQNSVLNRIGEKV